MLTINAEIRKKQGKGASRRLRRLENKFPAIIYGRNESPIAIELDHDLVMNIQRKENFYNEILVLVIHGREIKAKVQALQRHPFKPRLTHMDFVLVEAE